ncbi:MAG: phage major capsid protein [Bdellovibrionales bacterium]
MNRYNVKAQLSAHESGVFAGYASVFDGEPDSYGDVIAPGAFAKSLASHRCKGTLPVLLWQHDPGEPIGVWLDLREDVTGLSVTGRLVLETQRGREAYALLKAGALNGLSIGYRTRASERRAGGARVLQELELIEISLVTLPAASKARVTSIKAASAVSPAADEAANKRRQPMAIAFKAPTVQNEEGKDLEPRILSLEESVVNIDTRLKAVEEGVGKVAKSADRIEQKLNRPGFTPEIHHSTEKCENKAFADFLRRGREALQVDEVKALVVSPDTAGGYLAPSEFVAQVIKGIISVSPVRRAAKVGTTSLGAVTLPRRTATPTASWVGELTARSGTGSTYGQAEIQVHEMACYVDVSLRLLEDAAVNVEAEVASDLAEEFGRLEGASFVSGSGMNQPFGICSDANVNYTPTGNASGLPSSNPADPLISLIYLLPEFYRNSGVWMMNGTTLAALRKIKTGDGHYLWQPSFQVGQPETLLGRPVIEAPDMPNFGAGTTPIIFGDFSRAYRIFDHKSVSLLRDPYSQAASGLVRFHARRRVGAAVVLPEAIRKLKCATS